jgi:lysophospholipase L1-like esterase
VRESDLARILYSYRPHLLRATYRPLLRLGIDKSVCGIPPSEAELFSYHSTLRSDSEQWKSAVKFCLGNISRIINLAREHNIRLMITIYPHKEQLRPDKNGRLWNRDFEYRLAELCQARGVEYYSAFDAIRQAFLAGQPVFFAKDMHFTPEGQRIWGNLLATYVLDRLTYRAVDAAPFSHHRYMVQEHGL